MTKKSQFETSLRNLYPGSHVSVCTYGHVISVNLMLKGNHEDTLMEAEANLVAIGLEVTKRPTTDRQRKHGYADFRLVGRCISRAI